MTPRDLIEFFMRYDIDLPLYVDGSCPAIPECKLFSVRAEKTRIILTFDPNEPWEP